MKANRSATVSSFYSQNGFETPTSTPEELRRFQAAESEKQRKLITSPGIEKE